jgi:hypothetical protein
MTKSHFERSAEVCGLMSETCITATRAPDGGVVVTVYAKGGDIVIRPTLPWRRAALLGSDLLNLALEPVFTAANWAQTKPPGNAPGRSTRPRSDAGKQ